MSEGRTRNYDSSALSSVGTKCRGCGRQFSVTSAPVQVKFETVNVDGFYHPGCWRRVEPSLVQAQYLGKLNKFIEAFDRWAATSSQSRKWAPLWRALVEARQALNRRSRRLED